MFLINPATAIEVHIPLIASTLVRWTNHWTLGEWASRHWTLVEWAGHWTLGKWVKNWALIGWACHWAMVGWVKDWALIGWTLVELTKARNGRSCGFLSMFIFIVDLIIINIKKPEINPNKLFF